MIEFLTLDDILEIHQKQILAYGGTDGIRDTGLLESALASLQRHSAESVCIPTCSRWPLRIFFIWCRTIHLSMETSESGWKQHFSFLHSMTVQLRLRMTS